jgi:hypothetical protein
MPIRLRLVANPEAYHCAVSIASLEPQTKKLWLRWAGKEIIVGKPQPKSTLSDWGRVYGCDSDILWPVLGPQELLSQIPGGSDPEWPPAVCRHMLQAGD